MNEELNFSLTKMEEAGNEADRLTENYLEAIQTTDQIMESLEEYMNTGEIGTYKTVMDCYKEKKNNLAKLGEVMKQTTLTIKNKQEELEEKLAYLDSKIE